MKRNGEVTGLGRMKWLQLSAETPEEERRLARFYLELRRNGVATLRAPELQSRIHRKPE